MEATDANTSPVVKDVLQQNMPQKATYRSGHFVCVCIKNLSRVEAIAQDGFILCQEHGVFFCTFTTPEHFQDPTVVIFKAIVKFKTRRKPWFYNKALGE